MAQLDRSVRPSVLFQRALSQAVPVTPIAPGLRLVHRAADRSHRPTEPERLEKGSGLRCRRCNTPFDQDFQVWRTGPKKVYVDGDAVCANPRCPSNSGSDLPAVRNKRRRRGVDTAEVRTRQALVRSTRAIGSSRHTRGVTHVSHRLIAISQRPNDPSRWLNSICPRCDPPEPSAQLDLPMVRSTQAARSTRSAPG